MLILGKVTALSLAAVLAFSSVVCACPPGTSDAGANTHAQHEHMSENRDNECGHIDCVDECAQAKLIIVDQGGVSAKFLHFQFDDSTAIPVEHRFYGNQTLAPVSTGPPFIPLPRLADTPVRRNDRLLLSPLYLYS